MDNKTDKKEKKGFFFVLGGLFKVLFAIIGVLFKVLKKTGLIIPMLYALCGLVLYLVVGFNPLTFAEDVYLECVLYAVGFGLSAVACLIIAVKNLVIKPAKSFKKGFSSTLAKKKDKGEQGLPDIAVEEPKQASTEKPRIYYSEMQKRLIHEYQDRFEVYIQKGSQEILEKVEYKIDN